ncbi:MAG: sensor histidine kinase [Planctomycetota bacterium]|jgi:signal transduction histidine kinase
MNEMMYLDGFAQAIRYYDEVATQAVRNYAFAQDKKWEQRYKDAKSEFVSLVTEAIDKGEQRNKGLLSSVNQANLALVEMEKTSIGFVNNGMAEEAINILESGRYWDQKKIQEQNLEDYARRRGAELYEAFANSNRTVSMAMERAQNITQYSRRLVSIFTIIALVLALGSGFVIARSIYIPLQKLKAAATETGKGNLDTKIEIKSTDEIGRVAASFDKMIDDLKRTTTSIDNLSQEITDRKRAEKKAKLACEELEKANIELKKMQSERVQNAKLVSIGQLAAGIAHELNNPIGFVSSNFEALESYVTKMQELLQMYGELIVDIETTEKSELLDKLHVIDKTRNSMKIDFILEDIAGLFNDSREGFKRVSSIVQTLRDFSRIDQLGNLDTYNINDGIKTTLIVANNEVKYEIDVKTDLSEVPAIICNAGQINQVLLNLIINAAHAIKSQKRSRKGSIEIRTYATHDNVFCEISDNGPGIGSDDLSHIFDPFFTTKPAGHGTGLGLSISYDIVVSKHKGNLLVDSSVGKGTKFTMKLPLCRKKTKNESEVSRHERENRIVCG